MSAARVASFATVAKSRLGAMSLPNQVSVSQGAADTLILDDAGGYSGPWRPDEVPYLVEPMDTLASREHRAVVAIGPARSGKTAGMILGWLAHAAVNDPGRFMVMHMTEKKAEMLSKLDVANAIDASPKLKALKSPFGHDNNIGLRIFKHGMAVRFAWPSRSELAGTTYRYVALTDYDRFPIEQSKGGNIFDLALKRTETLMSRGMALLETSPEFPITDPRWRPATPHEAPPCDGGLGVYNRSDRRRFYWPCPHCGEFFQAEPGLANFHLVPDLDELIKIVRRASLPDLSAEWARIACVHCGAEIEFRHRQAMNAAGVWLRDGETIDAHGKRCGNPIKATIAGFWLGGISASYQSWDAMLQKYLQAVREYATTGSEQSLQATTNVDQGAPFLSQLQKYDADACPPESRTEPLQRYYVPDEARFVVVSVDVQGGQDARFVVQAHAHGPNHEQWLIDRYDIRASFRAGMGAEDKAPIDPASYPEDWDVLTERCVRATYKTSEDGRELRVLRTVVDTGGEDGVTENAYDWFRRLGGEGLQSRVILIKGASGRDAPIIKRSKVGGKKPSDGDVTLYLLNVNLLKDAVANNLRRTEPGAGYMHLPDWLTAPFFDELEAETRLPNGTWKKNRRRNEAFDLCAYQRAAAIILGVDRIKWANPPAWARPIDANCEAMTQDERRDMKSQPRPPAAKFRKTSMFSKR